MPKTGGRRSNMPNMLPGRACHARAAPLSVLGLSGWMDHGRLRSDGNSSGAGTDTAPRSSNAARFLVLCLLCMLLTGAYAWFTLGRSADRSGTGLPGISGPLDTALVQPAAGSPTAAEETNASAERPAERAAGATPEGATPGSRPAAVAADTDSSRNDAEAGKELPDTGAAETNTSRNDAEAGETLPDLPDTGVPDSTDRPAAFAGPAPEEFAAPVPPHRFLVRHTGLDRSHGFLAVETDAHGERTREATPLMCHRVHFAAGHGSCLMVERDFFTTYTAVLFDAAFQPRHRIPLNGIPSRTRVSPDGRHAAITVFVSGHSYADSLFSTETSIVDTGTGALVVANMEELPVVRGGQPFHSLDFNFWGVTFAADGDRFFATLGTGGVMHLVEGSLADRTLRVVTEGIECPALSPDETRIAFKKRMPGSARAHWRPHVLDLETLEETALAEPRSVDDQVEWLDDGNVLYALPEETGSPIADVWVLPADGGGRPEIFLEQASSPAVLRSGAPIETAITTEG